MGARVSIGALTETNLPLNTAEKSLGIKLLGMDCGEKSQFLSTPPPPHHAGRPPALPERCARVAVSGKEGGKGGREGSGAGLSAAPPGRAAGWPGGLRRSHRSRRGGLGAWVASLSLPSASPSTPGGRMNLERLRKRVRQYIDQVRRRAGPGRGGVAGEGAVGFPSRGKRPLAARLPAGRKARGLGASLCGRGEEVNFEITPRFLWKRRARGWARSGVGRERRRCGPCGEPGPVASS